MILILGRETLPLQNRETIPQQNGEILPLQIQSGREPGGQEIRMRSGPGRRAFHSWLESLYLGKSPSRRGQRARRRQTCWRGCRLERERARRRKAGFGEPGESHDDKGMIDQEAQDKNGLV